MKQPRALIIARAYWSRGEHPPLDVIFELASLGFDVETLEQTYCA